MIADSVVKPIYIGWTTVQILPMLLENILYWLRSEEKVSQQLRSTKLDSAKTSEDIFDCFVINTGSEIFQK